MRILYYDIDTLRADHLGCYGYLRDTSPNVDRVAREGVRFEHCYVSDAPCLPSRASMFTGRFGIHTGVVGHGGTAADIRPLGPERGFHTGEQLPGFIECLRRQGVYPVSFSPFAERHSAWWFYAGWREMFNTGKRGHESAEEVVPLALEWLKANAKRDNWLLHVNVWDPHTPYRAPEAFGNPFTSAPMETWYTEELRRKQWETGGSGGPRTPSGGLGGEFKSLRMPDKIRSLADYRTWVDNYDNGIRYADHHLAQILNALADEGVLDDTAIIITSDHGENLGELGVIGDHQVADHVTSRTPMIVRWPGVKPRVEKGLFYQTDLAATVVELLGGKVPAHWDGVSIAEALKAGKPAGRDFLVVSQCAWSCMRSARWGDWLFARCYHTGFKNLPERMLFNVAADPHELNDLAASQPALADRGQVLLEQWTEDMMQRSPYAEDPLWTVMREGGPFHTRNRLAMYLERLRREGPSTFADFLEKHPNGLA